MPLPPGQGGHAFCSLLLRAGASTVLSNGESLQRGREPHRSPARVARPPSTLVTQLSELEVVIQRSAACRGHPTRGGTRQGGSRTAALPYSVPTAPAGQVSSWGRVNVMPGEGGRIRQEPRPMGHARLGHSARVGRTASLADSRGRSGIRIRLSRAAAWGAFLTCGLIVKALHHRLCPIKHLA